MRSGALHRRLTASTNPFPHLPASLHTCTMTVGAVVFGRRCITFRYVIGIADRDLPLPPALPDRPATSPRRVYPVLRNAFVRSLQTPKPSTPGRVERRLRHELASA